MKRKNNNSGFGTIEVVLIIAVLISLALIFRSAITSYATKLMDSAFGTEIVLPNNQGE